MSTRLISEPIEDLRYQKGLVSDIRDKLLGRIEGWQKRPLSEIESILCIDSLLPPISWEFDCE